LFGLFGRGTKMEEKRYFQVSIKDYSSICPNCYWNQYYLEKDNENEKC